VRFSAAVLGKDVSPILLPDEGPRADGWSLNWNAVGLKQICAGNVTPLFPSSCGLRIATACICVRCKVTSANAQVSEVLGMVQESNKVACPKLEIENVG
jgi:hypothetical protein